MSEEEFKDATEYKNRLPRVVKVLDSETVVLNSGAADGVKMGFKFQIFAFGDEVIDTDTGRSLGILEIPKGVGEIISLQRKMAILSSSRTIERRNLDLVTNFGSYEVTPFRSVKAGDYARPV